MTVLLHKNLTKCCTKESFGRSVLVPSPKISLIKLISSLEFWLGFLYNFDITKILVIVVGRGRVDEFLVSVLCIAIVPLVVPVTSCRGCYCSSLRGTWRRGGLRNSGITASRSSSQYFNIIVQGVLVFTAYFWPLVHYPCPCVWRVRPPLFRFDIFFLSLELFPLLDLAIARDLLEPTLLLLIPLPLPRRLLPLEVATASSSYPPLSP